MGGGGGLFNWMNDRKGGGVITNTVAMLCLQTVFALWRIDSKHFNNNNNNGHFYGA